MDKERVKRAVAADMAVLKPCIMCGHPTFGRGVFFPDDSIRYGGNVDQQRIVIYGYCDMEPTDGSTVEFIESVIENQLKAA